jgi:hypothetical protein
VLKPVMSSRGRLWLAGLLLLLCVTACSLPPAKGLPAFSHAPVLPVTQQLEVRWREHSFSFLLIQQGLPAQAGLQVVATTLTGQQLFELAYDGKQLKVLQHVEEMKRLPFDYLLRDVLWASWPAASVQAGIQPYGYVLQEQADHRQIRAAGKLVLDVQRGSSGQLHVENKQAGYVLDITQVE